FQRTVASGWGTASDGHIWGADAQNGSQFSVSNAGIEKNGGGLPYTAILGSTVLDTTVLIKGSLSNYVTTGSNFGPVARYKDAGNWYKAYPDGTTFHLQKKVGNSTIQDLTTAFTAGVNIQYFLK